MFIDKLLSSACGTIFLLMLACSGPSAETETTAPPISVIRTLQDDPAFWDYAASSGMLQVGAGRLAIQKGSTPQVKALGEQAVNFHTQALQKLKALVAGHTFIHLPDSLGGADQGRLKELQELQGVDFDEGYLTFIQDTHTAQLQRYQEAMAKAQDQPTRDWLLAMEDHLRTQLTRIAAADSTGIPAE